MAKVKQAIPFNIYRDEFIAAPALRTAMGLGEFVETSPQGLRVAPIHIRIPLVPIVKQPSDQNDGEGDEWKLQSAAAKKNPRCWIWVYSMTRCDLIMQDCWN